MRLHYGSIPDEFEPDSSWRTIREPGPLLVQVIATPIGLGLAFVIGYWWLQLGDTLKIVLPSGAAVMMLVAFALSFPVLIVVHELIHAVVYPEFGMSRKSIIGVWPSRFLFYAHHSAPITKERFLAVFAMPFLVITIVPLVFASFGLLPKAWMFWATWFSTWNALFACGDAFGFFMILFQVPRRSLVQNKGWRTYWKPASTPPSAEAKAS